MLFCISSLSLNFYVFTPNDAREFFIILIREVLWFLCSLLKSWLFSGYDAMELLSRKFLKDICDELMLYGFITCSICCICSRPADDGNWPKRIFSRLLYSYCTFYFKSIW